MNCKSFYELLNQLETDDKLRDSERGQLTTDRDTNCQNKRSNEEISSVYEPVFRTNICSWVWSNQRDDIFTFTSLKCSTMVEWGSFNLKVSLIASDDHRDFTGKVSVSHERILFFKPDIFIDKFCLVSKKISICRRSFFVITWAESLKVREKITSRFLHNKNSGMNPWSSSFTIHVYISVDYFLSYIFPSDNLLCCVLHV